MSEWLFWSFLFMILYTYFGYPALFFLVSLFREKPVQKGDITPSVSIIIAVHNEEKIINKKMENMLAINYPKEKLEILVISDCSQDSTDQMIRHFERDGVKLIMLEQRRGKEYAQGVGVEQSRGEIMVFTDASAMLEKNALLNLVRNLSDPTVGCVTSEDRTLLDEGKESEEGAYVKYEMILRRLESKVGSVAGLSGSFFAIRRELCDEWSPGYASDFLLPLRSVMAGFRAVSDTHSLAYYKTVPSSQQEFRRKVRTVTRGLEVLFRNLRILNPLRFGFFSLQIISHKLFRWLVPFFLIIVFLTNLFLVTKHHFYLFFLFAQLLFYLMAGLAFLFPCLNKMKIFRIPSFFCLVNLSILVAWFETIGGKKHIVWEPSKRE